MLQCQQDITNWYNAIESHWFFERHICHLLSQKLLSCPITVVWLLVVFNWLDSCNWTVSFNKLICRYCQSKYIFAWSTAVWSRSIRVYQEVIMFQVWHTYTTRPVTCSIYSMKLTCQLFRKSIFPRNNDFVTLSSWIVSQILLWSAVNTSA